MNERNMLLRQIQALKFSIWELHIFLDTHPNDAEAMKMLHERQMKCDMLVKHFEEQFGPLTVKSECKNRWAWITDPWPWENCANAEEVR